MRTHAAIPRSFEQVWAATGIRCQRLESEEELDQLVPGIENVSSLGIEIETVFAREPGESFAPTRNRRLLSVPTSMDASESLRTLNAKDVYANEPH